MTLVVAAVVGCVRYECQYTFEPIEARVPQMSVLPVELPRASHQPQSMRFRLAIMNFTDQTNAAGDLTRTIPDVISTALYERNRFDLYDRGQLRNKTAQESQRMAKELPVDGIVQGAITQFRPDDQVIVCDIRITNKHTDVVMYAESAEFRYTGKLELNLQRADIEKLSERIRDRFPKLDQEFESKVIKVDGQNVQINAGVDHKLINGLVLLVQAPSDLKVDPDSQEVLGSRRYVAEIALTSVLDKYSHGRVIPNTGTVRVGDAVIAK